MMNFRTVKAALITLLGDAAAGRYEVFGYQRQGQAAEELVDSRRNVQVYYAEGDFPKSKSSINGPSQHDVTFNIDCLVSKKAEVDLSALTNPAATPEEKALALSAMRPAGYYADESLDELFDIIYQVIMDARNQDLGLDPDMAVASRWVGRMSKDSPIPAGDHCVLTGIIRLTLSVDEQYDGLVPVLATDGIDTDIIHKDEFEAQMGVINAFTFLVDDDSGDFLVDDESGDYIIEG